MKKLFLKFFNYLKSPRKYNSKAYTRYLKKRNVTIGEETYFFDPTHTYVDTNNGMFIKIGKFCKITSGVHILAHDYSYSILRRVYHEIPKKAGMTIIGDNVFVGLNSIILSGSKNGSNVIIGSGSVVSGVIPDNEVWAGNPAKFICTLEDYYKKCSNNFEKSAIITIKRYNELYQRNPTIQELQYFSLLFLNNDKQYDNDKEIKEMCFNGDNKEEVEKDCLKYKSKYNSYKDLLDNINKQ